MLATTPIRTTYEQLLLIHFASLMALIYLCYIILPEFYPIQISTYCWIYGPNYSLTFSRCKKFNNRDVKDGILALGDRHGQICKMGPYPLSLSGLLTSILLDHRRPYISKCRKLDLQRYSKEVAKHRKFNHGLGMFHLGRIHLSALRKRHLLILH